MAKAKKPAGYPATPELDKITSDVRVKAELVADFLAFLGERYEFAKYFDMDESDPSYNEDLYGDQQALCPQTIRPEHLIHEFFGIDYNKCQDERDKVLEYVQDQAEQSQAGN